MFEKMRFGCDIGGTKTEFVVINGKNEVLFRERSNNKKTFDGNLENIFSLADSAINKLKINRIEKIGMSLKGVMDPIHNSIEDKSIEWLNNNLLAGIRKKYSCEIVIQNDANCFALAESVLGAGKGHKTGLFLILGTGAGAGIVFNSQIYLLIDGLNNFCGEWGKTYFTPRREHIEIFNNYEKHLGKKMTTEDIIAGPGFLDVYNFINSKQLTSPMEIMQCCRNGDETAKKYFDFYLDTLAFCLHGFLNMIAPEIIVLGGGLSNIEEITAELPKYLRRYLDRALDNIKVRKNSLGDSAGAIGACLL